MPTGRVRWYDDVRGFGFFSQDGGGQEVFFHYTTVEGHARFPLVVGQLATFDVVEQPGDVLVAANVRRVRDEAGRFETAPGGDAVQLRAIPRRPNLRAMAERLRPFGAVRANDLLVRLCAPPHTLTLFDDGSAIVEGTAEEEEARRLAGLWLGVRIPD